MALRELAWRVSARELESSLEEEKGGGERPVTYVLSPFGARMNRVLVAGEISPPEPVGREDPPMFWRSRLADPTGAVAVTAGGFQPRAMAQLRALDAPTPALVVGKVHLYHARDGIVHVSVRAESLRPVGENDERSAVAEVVRQTIDRLDLLERVERDSGATDDILRAEGVPFPWIRAARAALHRYPTVDRAAFRRELAAAVRRVAGDSGPRAFSAPPPPSVRVTARAPPATAAAPSAAARADESIFLDLVDQAADSSVDGYADLKDVLQLIAARGVAADRAEATLNRLEEDGVLEEPVVGKLRRA